MKKHTSSINETTHNIDITNDELRTLILNGIREDYPEIPFPFSPRVYIIFDLDMARKANATVKWTVKNETSD